MYLGLPNLFDCEGERSYRTLPFAGRLIKVSVRYYQQPALQQLFRQPVDGPGKLVGDGADRHPQQTGGFGLGVLLQNDAAEHYAVERTKLVQALFHVEDEDDRVLEGADGTAGTPPLAIGSPRMLGALPTCMDA